MSSAQDSIKERLQEHAEVMQKLDAERLEEIAGIIIDCCKKGGKVLLFGNGGSAADAQHFAAELINKYALDRKGLPAIALTENPVALTAIANDFGFETVFEKQVEALAHGNDVAIGISTSGTSKNVILGLQKAKSLGAKTVAFCGRGGAVADAAETVLHVDSESTPIIQEAHITAIHIICGIVENHLFGGAKK